MGLVHLQRQLIFVRCHLCLDSDIHITQNVLDVLSQVQVDVATISIDCYVRSLTL